MIDVSLISVDCDHSVLCRPAGADALTTQSTRVHAQSTRVHAQSNITDLLEKMLQRVSYCCKRTHQTV